MVDEFQDTNRLQTELLDLLAGRTGEQTCFVVGDEFQSIYGFRHADVAVFRERRAVAPTVLPLTQNYRSRPEVLAAVNELFGAEFGDEFQSLEPAADCGVAASERRSSCSSRTRPPRARQGVHWRRSEARHVARRVRELVDAGDATPGEIVLLFAAGHRRRVVRGGAPRRRPADLPRRRPQLLRPAAGRRPARLPAAAAQPLRRRGAAHRARLAVRRRLERRARADPGGRAAAADLPRHRARAARRPRRRATGACCWRSASATTGSSSSRRTRRSSSSASGSWPSTTTTSRSSRAATGSGGTRTCASSRGSPARTRSFAARTSRASSASSPGQEAVGAKESDAVSEEEGADAVRLLTIHAAKGLEFKVVVVADAGREPAARRPTSSRSRTAASASRSRIRRTGTRVSTESYKDVQGAPRPCGAGRAAAPLLRRDDAGDGAADRLRLDRRAGRRQRRDADRLGARAGSGSATRRGRTTAGPIEIERGAATVVLRIDRGAAGAGADVRQPRRSRRCPTPRRASSRCSRASGEALPPPAPRLRELTVVPEPPLHRVARLSFSALSLFERCSYRYYAERVAGMRPVAWDAGDGGRAAGCTRPRRATRCTACSSASTSRAPRAARRARASSSRAWYPAVTRRRARAHRSRSSRVLRLVARRGASRRSPESASSGRSCSSSTACC